MNIIYRKLDLTFTKLTPFQSDSLFEELQSNKFCRLREASFKAANLQNVKASSLAEVISRLEKVNLSFTELTKDQLTALCERINKRRNVNIKDIELFSVDLSPVNPKVLGKAVSFLENANLSNTELSHEQIQEILKFILDTKITRELNLDFSEVFNINQDLFARSVSLISSVSLACSGRAHSVLIYCNVGTLLQPSEYQYKSLELLPQ